MPVIDGVAAGVKLLEGLIALNLRTAKDRRLRNAYRETLGRYL